MNELLTVILSGMFVLAAAAITYRSTTRAARISRDATAALEQNRVRVDELKVAREAYETANRITGGLLSGLTREVERLNHEVADLRASNRRLEQTSRALIDVLHEHDIPIPQIGH